MNALSSVLDPLGGLPKPTDSRYNEELQRNATGECLDAHRFSTHLAQMTTNPNICLLTPSTEFLE